MVLPISGTDRAYAASGIAGMLLGISGTEPVYASSNGARYVLERAGTVLVGTLYYCLRGSPGKAEHFRWVAAHFGRGHDLFRVQLELVPGNVLPFGMPCYTLAERCAVLREGMVVQVRWDMMLRIMQYCDRLLVVLRGQNCTFVLLIVLCGGSLSQKCKWYWSRVRGQNCTFAVLNVCTGPEVYFRGTGHVYGPELYFRGTKCMYGARTVREQSVLRVQPLLHVAPSAPSPLRPPRPRYGC
eukprot:844702-Rhodomonas_salina.2